MIFSKPSHTLAFAAGILVLVGIAMSFQPPASQPARETPHTSNAAHDGPLAATVKQDPATRANGAAQHAAAEEEVIFEDPDPSEWGQPMNAGEPMISTNPDIEPPFAAEPEHAESDPEYGAPMIDTRSGNDY